MAWANEAMVLELATEPSFGLVTLTSQGAHKDMDADTYQRSIMALTPYFLEMAEACFKEVPWEHHFEEMVALGKAYEERMLEATGGINTHKGLVFVLGTLVAATAKVVYQKQPLHEVFAYTRAFGEWKFKELTTLGEAATHGEAIYQKHRIGGAREEARQGFPLIHPIYQRLNVDDKEELTRMLILLMRSCDDSTVIHRVGVGGLAWLKQSAGKVVENGFKKEAIEALSEACIRRGISPGGSADLLTAAIFLSLVHRHYQGREDA